MIVDISVLNAPRDNLDGYFKNISNCPIVHLDVMDGKFVPNYTFGAEFVKEVHLATPRSICDVHLMVEDPDSYMEDMKEAGADYLTFHYEVGDIERRIDKIHSLGMKAGLSIKPATDVNVLIPYLENLDYILIMSVEPGKGGQEFLSNSIEKVKYLKEYKTSHKLHYLIAIDGGINLRTGQLVKEYCDLGIVGSAITKAENYVEAYYEHLKALF